MPHKNLRVFSLACGVTYLVTQHWQPYPGSFAVKGLSIAALALLAFLLGRKVSFDFLILGIALTLSSIGDVLLDLDPEKLFVAGLGSFLLAHLTYVVLFIRNRPKPFTMGIAQVLPMILVLLYTLTISAWLLPSPRPAYRSSGNLHVRYHGNGADVHTGSLLEALDSLWRNSFSGVGLAAGGEQVQDPYPLSRLSSLGNVLHRSVRNRCRIHGRKASQDTTVSWCWLAVSRNRSATSLL
jgi:hypothetical protein